MQGCATPLNADPLGGMILALACLGLAIFAALPAAVLITRYRQGRRFPWLAAVLIIAVGGWLSANAVNYFYSQHACMDVYGVANPPPADLEFCTNDGARNVFTLFFGWLYALIYSSPFFLLFAIAAGLRARRSTHAT